MTALILITVILGIGAGYFFIPSHWLTGTDLILDIGLCILLLFVGMDMGRQRNIFKEIKAMGISFIMMPLLIAVGSIVGGLLSGLVFGFSWNEGSALGAGFGWYSLSSVLLTQYSSELSAIAFLSNVFREIIAILSIPLISKYLGYLESIAPSGATAMDTTLPIISKATDSKTAILAFVSGVILSALVPILVPFFIAL